MMGRRARTLTRRDLLARGGALLATLGSASVLESCFGTGTSNNAGGGGSKGHVTVWDISTGPAQTLLQQQQKKWNTAHPDIQVTYEFFQNDPYKQKLQVAMGAHNPPDVFFGWGGGILESYVKAGDVADITAQVGEYTQRFLPHVMEPATINGKIYGVPFNGITPVVLEYNKSIFSKYGLQPPKSWNDLLQLVGKLKQQGVIPIAVAGQSTWTYLMYEMLLVDRIGGPNVFQAILANKPNAWSHPAVIQANTMIQDLVDAGAFGQSYQGINYDTGQSTALLTTEKAAMQLMGTWDFNTILNSAPDFLSKLGLAAFPAVEEGKGDPSNAVGVLANFRSVTTASKAKDAAIQFLKDGSLDNFTTDGYIKLDQVPPVKGIESKLKASPQSGFLLWIYNASKNAAHFQLAWDQALPPQPAQQILTNLDQLFLKQITPSQFSASMNKTLGT